MQDEEESWMLTYAEKKKLYGSMLVKVGGKNEPDDDPAGLVNVTMIKHAKWPEAVLQDVERTRTWSRSATIRPHTHACLGLNATPRIL